MTNILFKFLMICLILSSCENKDYTPEDIGIFDIVLENTKNEIWNFNLMINSIHPNEIERLLISEHAFKKFEFKNFNTKYIDLIQAINKRELNNLDLIKSIDSFTQDLKTFLLKKDNSLGYNRFEEILYKVRIDGLTEIENITKVELGVAIIFLEYIKIIKSNITLQSIPFDNTKLIILDTIRQGEGLKLFGGLSLSEFGNIFEIEKINQNPVNISCSYDRKTGFSTCLLDKLKIGVNRIKGYYRLKYVEKFPFSLELFDTHSIENKSVYFEANIYVKE